MGGLGALYFSFSCRARPSFLSGKLRRDRSAGPVRRDAPNEEPSIRPENWGIGEADSRERGEEALWGCCGWCWWPVNGTGSAANGILPADPPLPLFPLPLFPSSSPFSSSLCALDDPPTPFSFLFLFSPDLRPVLVRVCVCACVCPLSAPAFSWMVAVGWFPGRRPPRARRN